MIIKVPKSEQEIVRELCITMDYKCRFFTMENNNLMVQCEVIGISAECSYHFGRMIQLKIEQEQGKERLKKFPYNIL